MSMPDKSVQAALACILVLLIPGCSGRSREGGERDTRVVAEINDYAMTVTDFNSDKTPFLKYMMASADADKAQEQVLEELIRKEILVQEAQRLGLDRDKAFMKEIENHWKQALLKSLLKRKSEELAGSVRVTRQEIEEAYRRLQRRVRAVSVTLADRESASALSNAGNDFDTVIAQLRPKIISQSGPEWWTGAELERELEDAIFTLRSGQISRPFAQDDSWVVVRVLDEEPAVPPSEKNEPLIEEQIRQRKINEALNAWVADLRQRARVTVNHDMLRRADSVSGGDQGGE